ncbi:MAG: ABC transporter ATP-binding protein [Desulfobacter sp.]
MSTVISVENLGKKYTLHHEQREQYTALRDVIANGVKNLGKKMFSSFTFHPSPFTDSQEDFWALKDVSFEVKQGDRIGIIGRNGAGKSTLLKILSRITEPTTGRVKIKGRVASLLEVGTGFHPELTGRENIYLNGAILGMSRMEIKKKFDEIVDFAEIERFLDTPVKRFSSGMYVRLAFSVAAHLESEILVVDEVLAVGDAQFQKKCLGKMSEVSLKESRTVLFVSHNMAAMKQLCRKGIWLDAGAIDTTGTIDEAISAYLSAGAEINGERRWNVHEKAPGNSKIRLVSIRVRDSSKEINSILDMSKPFYVEIEYDVLQAHSGMRTGFWVYTSDGVLVFVAGDSEDSGWQSRKRMPGRYVSICTLPPMLLNSGTYSITVGADIPGSELLFLEQAVLSIVIEHTAVTVLDGANRSPGIICPSLNWHISKVDNHA